MELKRIDVESSAQVGAALYGAGGLLAALLLAGLSISGAVGEGSSLGRGLAGAALVLIFVPIAHAALGAFIAAIAAAIYNVTAAKVGGIRLHLE